jgi:hypothetical protein
MVVKKCTCSECGYQANVEPGSNCPTENEVEPCGGKMIHYIENAVYTGVSLMPDGSFELEGYELPDE